MCSIVGCRRGFCEVTRERGFDIWICRVAGMREICLCILLGGKRNGIYG